MASDRARAAASFGVQGSDGQALGYDGHLLPAVRFLPARLRVPHGDYGPVLRRDIQAVREEQAAGAGPCPDEAQAGGAGEKGKRCRTIKRRADTKVGPYKLYGRTRTSFPSYWPCPYAAFFIIS